MNAALGLFGFLLTSLYCPFIEGAAVVPRWLMLSAVVPMMLLGLLLDGRRVVVTWAHIAGAAFLGWAALSMAWSATPYDSVDAMWKLALLGGCFALGSLVADWRPFLIGCALGLSVSSALVVFEAFTGLRVEMLSGAQYATRYAALFGNRNYLGEAAALVLVGLIAVEAEWGWRPWPPVRFWLLVGALMPALLITGSRGALLAVAVVAGWAFWPLRLRWALWSAGAVMLAGFIGLAYWSSATGIIDRLNIWRDAVMGLTWFGHGIGSFGGALQAHFTDPMITRNVYAHNDLLQIAFELGLPGGGLALAFIWLIMRGESHWPYRLVFAAFLVEGLFGFVLHLPVSGVVGLCMAGAAARGLPRVRLAHVFGRSRIHAGRGAVGVDASENAVSQGKWPRSSGP